MPTPTPPPPTSGRVGAPTVTETFQGHTSEQSLHVEFHDGENPLAIHVAAPGPYGPFRDGRGVRIDSTRIAAEHEPIEISYDAGSKSYTVRLGTETRSFAPEHQLPPAGPGDQVVVHASAYRTGNAAQGDVLYLFDDVAAPNAPLLLQHVSYGAWQKWQPSGAGQQLELRYFVYGRPTPIGDMPTSGTATYRTWTAGSASNEGDRSGFCCSEATLWALYTTSSKLTANFGAGRVDLHLSLGGSTTIGSSPGGSAGSYKGSGPISGSSFAGPLADFNGNPGTSGGFEGSFYGPGAGEVGLTYWLTSPSFGTLNGALVGTRE